jgi:hypothetical protein
MPDAPSERWITAPVHQALLQKIPVMLMKTETVQDQYIRPLSSNACPDAISLPRYP